MSGQVSRTQKDSLAFKLKMGKRPPPVTTTYGGEKGGHHNILREVQEELEADEKDNH